MEKILNSLTDRLQDSEVHRHFADHEFFKTIRSGVEVNRDQVGIFLGQWWYPLHYFTTFLARCVATLPDTASKSAVTCILNQEAGGGDADQAHETIYVDSMVASGFDRATVTETAPYPETSALVEGYREASGQRWSALGFIFATEVTDLLMVSSIGTAVERATGVPGNKWVSIHIEQEPDHVEEAEHTLLAGFSLEEEDEILHHANQMWTLWTAFFDRLSVETGVGAPSATYAATQPGQWP